MSKIALSGNASGTGTFTIAAPNSSTDRTLTLPDATGTINTSGAVNEVPAGSASAPSIYPTGDTNTGLFFPAADTIAFAEGGAEVARFDSSGNLLVGTTDSGSGATAAKQRIIGANANNLYLGSTSTGGWRITSDALSDGGTFYHIKFSENGTQRGSITSNGSSTSYTTTSDYRLKENIAPITGALATVAQLNPVTYTWKSTGEAGQGFIAHELQAIVPDCVSGEKDAIDAEGSPQYQGVDTSFLVATLTAAIQELKAELDTVKAEVEALKGQA